MSDCAKELLESVIGSMEALNRYFDEKIEALREKGIDEKEIQGLIKGSYAMKDASNIYLSWSSHYLQQIEKGMNSLEEEDFQIQV